MAKKALQCLTFLGLAPPSDEVLREMQYKHPQSNPPSLQPHPSVSPIVVSKEAVALALKSFPTCSAPGPSCLPASHLKHAIFCPSPDKASRALLSLTRVVSLLCSGRVPSAVIPHLCEAFLLPCKKKNGGLWPIAVGEVLRRLTSKCAGRAVLSESINILYPLQVGVGVSSGCEAIIHSVSDVLEDNSIHPDQSIFFSWTFQMYSILCPVTFYSRKCCHISPLSTHGWNAHMAHSPFYY